MNNKELYTSPKFADYLDDDDFPYFPAESIPSFRSRDVQITSPMSLIDESSIPQMVVRNPLVIVDVLGDISASDRQQIIDLTRRATKIQVYPNEIVFLRMLSEIGSYPINPSQFDNVIDALSTATGRYRNTMRSIKRNSYNISVTDIYCISPA